MRTELQQLTEVQAEQLTLLYERFGEAQEAVARILWHGYNSTRKQGGPTNQKTLKKELEDVKSAISLLEKDLSVGVA